MKDLTGTNELDANGMDNKVSFLREGIYDILTVTKSDGSKGMQCIAKVRRFSNGVCNYENVNLLYLFTKDCNGPMMKFQPDLLIDHVINITACIPQRSNSGKTYYSYNWEINTELTERLKEQLQELISDEFLYNEAKWEHEQYLINEQNIEDNEEWLVEEFHRNEQNIQDYQEQLIEDQHVNEQNLEDEQDHQRDLELDDDHCDIDED